MPMMKTLQNLRLETTEGAILRFKANEPKYVPPRAVSAATAKGCVMVDEKDRTFHEDLQRSNVDFSGELRQSLLFLAVKSTMEKNNVKDFDGSGSPSAEAIEKLVGFSVATSEILPIYHLWHQVSEGADYQVHPDAAQVQCVMEAANKSELQEIAAELGIEEKDYKPLTVKELHKLLLVKLSGYAPE